LANGIDTHAVETYKKNIGRRITRADIKDMHISDLPATDVAVGGFPCRGFSQANLLCNVDDERNKLYPHFYWVIKEKQLKYFVAENVKGILSLDGGNAGNADLL
jgi:DNA (cytosine-5)-methyltransferase 1